MYTYGIICVKMSKKKKKPVIDTRMPNYARTPKICNNKKNNNNRIFMANLLGLLSILLSFIQSILFSTTKKHVNALTYDPPR